MEDYSDLLVVPKNAHPLSGKPLLKNSDGSYSTEETITIEENGKYFVIPTIVNGQRKSEDEAINLFRKGKNKDVGSFNSLKEANDYASLRTKALNIEEDYSDLLTETPAQKPSIGSIAAPELPADVIIGLPETIASGLMDLANKAAGGWSGLREVAAQLKQGSTLEEAVLSPTIREAIEGTQPFPSTPETKTAQTIYQGFGELIATYNEKAVPAIVGLSDPKTEQERAAKEEFLKAATMAVLDVGAIKGTAKGTAGLTKSAPKELELPSYKETVPDSIRIAETEPPFKVTPHSPDMDMWTKEITAPDGNYAGKYEGVIDKTKNELTVRTQDINPTYQKQGLGSRTLKEVVDYGVSNKMVIKSDASLTEGAVKTWENLAGEYIIEKNPDAIVQKGRLVSEAPGIPVFKVYERKLIGDEVPSPKVDYGKIYAQADAENTMRTVTKDIEIDSKILPKNPSQLVVDERPIWALKPDLYNVETYKEPKFGTATTETTTREYTAKFQDLPDRYGVGGRLIPGRGQFVSHRAVGIFKRNPIVKWVASQVERERLYVQNRFHEIMYGSDVVMKYGKPTWVPSDRGWRTQLEKLPLEQRVNVIKARDFYDEPGRVARPERGVLEAHGLSPEAIDVFYKDYDIVRDVAAARNSTAKSLNKAGYNIKEFEMHEGYSPHIWEGDYRVFVKNKAGEVVQTATANTVVGAKLVEKKLREQYGNKYTTNYYARKDKTNDMSVEAINDLIAKATERFPEEASEIRSFLESQKDIKGINVHGLQRKGARGFLGDPKTQLNPDKLVKDFIQSRELFVHGMLRADSSLRLRYNMDLLKEDPAIKRLYPNSIKYSGSFVDDYLGKKTLADELISKYTAGIVGQTGVKKVLEKASSTMTVPVLLVSSIPNIAVQPFQIGYGAIKSLALRNELGLNAAQVHVNFLRGLTDMGPGKTPEIRQVALEAGKRGAVAPEFIEQMFETEAMQGRPLQHSKWYKDIATGKLQYAIPDEYSRLAQTFGFYRVLRAGGKAHEVAMYDAIELSKHYSTPYNHAERPAGYRGTVGQVVGKFSTWSSNQYAQMLEHVDIAKHGDLTPLASYLAYSALVAGMYGFWGINEADSVVEKVNEKFQTTYRLPSMHISEVAPDWLAYGPIQSALDYTTGTTDLPNFNRRLTSLPLVDFYTEVGTSVSTLISKYMGMGSPPDKLDLERALVSFAPRSMHAYIKNQIERGTITILPEGETALMHDPKTGKGAYRMDRQAQIINYFGGKTTEQHKISLINRWVQTVEANRKLTVQDWAKYVAISASMDMPINLDKFADTVAEEYMITPKEFKQSVKAAAKQFNTSIEERMFSIQSKKGRRAGAQYFDQLEYDSYEDLLKE